MLFASSEDKTQKFQALPGATGYCPMCRASLIPKCGKIVTWHWSHRSADCDPWYEPEGDWHRGWKARVSPDSTEVTIKRGDTLHRADIVAANGTVVELQHSSISPATIIERETFYQDMAWLFDARSWAIHLRRGPVATSTYRSFRWKRARKTLRFATAPLFFDLGDGAILEIRKLHFSQFVGGWGYIITYADFIKRIMEK